MRPFLLVLLLATLHLSAQVVITPSGPPTFTTGTWIANRTCPAHQVLIRTTINGGVCIQLNYTDIAGTPPGGGATGKTWSQLNGVTWSQLQ